MKSPQHKGARRRHAAQDRRDEHRRGPRRAQHPQHEIVAFRGYGNRQQAHLQGHIGQVGRESTLLWRRRAGAHGARAGRVTLQIGAHRRNCALSPQGYYSATLAVPDDPCHGESPWRDVLVIADTGHGARTAHHRVMIPPADPALLVIWDIDGTLVRADDSRRLPGAAQFCRGLRQGPDRARDCPLFFVSGRRWDHYLSLSRDLAALGLPEAPLLLNPAPPAGCYTDEQRCKAAHLRQILDTYPKSPAVLAGTVPALCGGPLHDELQARRSRFAAVYALDPDAGRALRVSGLITVRNFAEAARDALSRSLVSRAVSRRVAQRAPGG